MLANVGPMPAMAMKSVGAWPVVAITCFSPDGTRRSNANPMATMEVNTSARNDPSSRLFPVVQTNTGSGTKPYDLYSATTSVPTSPAVNPML